MRSRPMSQRWVTLRTRLEPTPYGMPSALAVTWFPVLVLLVFLSLVAMNLNGSSSAEAYGWFNGGADPGQVLGRSRPVRSDEWFVQLSWTISQFHQNFPPVNPSLPGGTDLTTLYDVPTSYWTVIFRPQLWGYFFLGLSHGLAWQWWLPAALTAIAAYLLVITVNPRRPVTGALLALCAIVCPLQFWWWQTSVFLSVGWPLFVMAGTIWIIRDPRWTVRAWWAVTAGFFAVNLALASYIPFILSCAWVGVIFVIGVAIGELHRREIPARTIVRRLSLLVAAGAGAATTIGIYALLRRDSLEAIAGTVYPGQRSDPTGALADGAGVLSLFAAPFNGALRRSGEFLSLGPNQSEASTSLLVAVFLFPGLLLLAVAARRATGRWSWPALSVLAATGLYLAYLFVGHWDVGARILLLDRVPAARARLAFAALLPAAAAVTLLLVDQLPSRVRQFAAALTAIVVVTINVAVWRGLRGETPNPLAADHLWRVAVIALCLGTVALFFRQLAGLGALALLVAATAVSAGVVPLHRGLVDLEASEAGQAVQEIDAADPGMWVGTRFPITTALLVQSGVDSLNAVQSYPSLPLWSALDPTSAREETWNRYAHLDWQIGNTGETREELLAPDHLLITMDPCSDFAQDEVTYVVSTSDQHIPTSTCLAPLRTIKTPGLDLTVLRVVPPA